MSDALKHYRCQDGHEQWSEKVERKCRHIVKGKPCPYVPKQIGGPGARKKGAK